MRPSALYESERGFDRCSSRLRHTGLRVSPFAADVRSSCTDSVLFPYELFQDRLAAPHLAVQTCRIFGPSLDAGSLGGNLYNSGFAFQFAARAQASSQLPVSAWLLPPVPASALPEAMLTRVLPTEVAARQRQTIQGSVVSPSYNAQESFAP